MVGAEAIGRCWGDGLSKGDLVALRAIWRAATLATVASFDTWIAFSETRRLWGAVPVDISVEIVWRSAVSRATGGVAAGTGEGARHRGRWVQSGQPWNHAAEWRSGQSHQPVTTPPHSQDIAKSNRRGGNASRDSGSDGALNRHPGQRRRGSAKHATGAGLMTACYSPPRSLAAIRGRCRTKRPA